MPDAPICGNISIKHQDIFPPPNKKILYETLSSIEKGMNKYLAYSKGGGGGGGGGGANLPDEKCFIICNTEQNNNTMQTCYLIFVHRYLDIIWLLPLKIMSCPAK